jgi:hypothetical protein
MFAGSVAEHPQPREASAAFWIKDLHITVQFAVVKGMWIPFSVDAIATVRFLGIYSLSAVDLVPPIAGSSPPILDKQCLC